MKYEKLHDVHSERRMNTHVRAFLFWSGRFIFIRLIHPRYRNLGNVVRYILEKNLFSEDVLSRHVIFQGEFKMFNFNDRLNKLYKRIVRHESI